MKEFKIVRIKDILGNPHFCVPTDDGRLRPVNRIEDLFREEGSFPFISTGMDIEELAEVKVLKDASKDASKPAIRPGDIVAENGSGDEWIVTGFDEDGWAFGVTEDGKMYTDHIENLEVLGHLNRLTLDFTTKDEDTGELPPDPEFEELERQMNRLLDAIGRHEKIAEMMKDWVE